MDLNLYRAFVASVDHGSITAAATLLGLTRPTLSRQLSALEDQVGFALLLRSTRRVQPTPAGRRLYARVQPMVRELEGVEAGLREERDDVSGVLRVSVPPVIAPDIGGALMDLARQHRRLRVELFADERWADLREDGVEIAVRAGRLKDPSLVRRKLGSRLVSAVASPSYLARHGHVASVDALAAHVLLRGHGPDGAPQRWWPSRTGGRIPVDGGFVCNDQRTLVQLALEGHGISLASDVSAGRAVDEGLLQRVLPEHVGTQLLLHAVYNQSPRQPPRVRVALEALVRWSRTFGDVSLP
jgi:DNA-binding transcriptional LysR family regulator